MSAIKLVSTKVSKFSYVIPTTNHYVIPTWIKDDEIINFLKEVLYDFYGINYVKINRIDVFNSDEEFVKYRFNIAGFNDLRAIINKNYNNIKIPEIKENIEIEIKKSKEKVDEIQGEQLSFF